jgi:hypothetical protein
MTQPPEAGLASAAERLFQLGRESSALALLERVTPSTLSREQLHKLKAVAETREDLDMALTMTRHLIVKLKGAETEADIQEFNALIGSEMGALAILHNLPKAKNPVQPVSGRVAYVLHHSLPYFSNGYDAGGGD